MDSQENVLNQEEQLEENKVVEAPVENEAPAEEAPAEEAPVEEAPAEEAPVEEAPAEEAPVEEAPAEEAPVEEVPAEEAPVEEAPVEEAPVEEAPVEEEPVEEESPAEEKKVYTTKQEVIVRLKELAHGDENPTKEEVDYLKTTFYKLHFAQREAEQKAYLDAGGDPEKYVVTPDEDEETFKAEMVLVKEKRTKLFVQQEEEKQTNLKRKLEIIEKIKGMATSPEEANRNFQEFKQLQQEWKEIKQVPAEKANELWRNYQLYVEQFYDLLKLNSEAREYDFKKNLEIKTRLCEAAEKLDEETDIISAASRLLLR